MADDSLDGLKKEIGGDAEVSIQEVNILFLDISSTCTGYSIYSLNFGTKQAILKKAGCLWLDPNWDHAEKYSYMFHALSNYFWVVEQVDYIVVEQYSINPKRMVGVHVVPEMMGTIKTAAWENGIKVASILPQTWRSQLGIKAVQKNGERDWKQPTADAVNKFVTVPEEVVSNISKQTRKTPSDLYDAIAIGQGWLKKFGVPSITPAANVVFNPHVGIIQSKGDI